MRALAVWCLTWTLLGLSGCDLLGVESADKIAARRDAEGRAIGSACRHAGRALEDCYALNKKADKSAVFNGWRDMNDYMREHNIREVVPDLTPTPGQHGAPAESTAPSAKPGQAPDSPGAAPAASAPHG